jgi:hypothetical protein
MQAEKRPAIISELREFAAFWRGQRKYWQAIRQSFLTVTTRAGSRRGVMETGPEEPVTAGRLNAQGDARGGTARCPFLVVGNSAPAT